MNIKHYVIYLSVLMYLRICCCERNNHDFQSNNESNSDLRIVGGKDATLGQIPYQVSFKLRFNDTNEYWTICGGSIINAHIVLSAAHCFEAIFFSWYERSDDIEPSIVKQFGYYYLPSRVRGLRYLYAHAGTLKTVDILAKTDSMEHGQWRKLKAVHLHPDYFLPRFDIAVVKLRKPFLFDSAVSSIPYASVTIRHYKGDCLISGYGSLSSKQGLLIQPKTLQYAYVRTHNEAKYPYHKHAIFLEGPGSKTGKGDSGGPLVCYNTGDPKENGTGLLVGTLTGKIYFRDSNGSFTLYSRVSKAKDFIDCIIDNCVLTKDDYVASAVLFVAITGVIIITFSILK